MLPQEFIRKKRDRQPLSREEIGKFIEGITKGEITDSQIAAFCMAVFLNGMEKQEAVELTRAMASSGEIVDWKKEELDGPVLDKHSTGGVGDKVSLILAPLVAACGGYVPMISGRGLGHTGGTLDKMDSIPGYVTLPQAETFKKVVKNTGCAIVGATHHLAPADRRIYAVRDVTATVESIDLITASILSKKLAAGLEGLVMDVKFGSGAFMRDYGDARALAEMLVEVAQGAGLPCHALLTDMNEVLGRTTGNAIEVREAIEFLRGEGQNPRLYAVILALVGEMLAMGGLAGNVDEGLVLAEKNLANGRAADFFGRMVHDLGGPADILEKFEFYLELAPLKHEVLAADAGDVESVDVRKLGLAVVELGGGRKREGDVIDHGVGLAAAAEPGETVGPAERPLAVLYGRDQDALLRADRLVREAYRLAPHGAPGTERPVIRERVVSAQSKVIMN